MKDLSDAAFIRRFTRVMSVLVLILIGVAVYAGVMSIGSDRHPELVAARVAQRLSPVGSAVTSSAAAAPVTVAASTAGAGQAQTGEQVVGHVCSACHGSGMLGAPKIGSKADWGPRFKSQGGLSGLVKHAINGLGQMPPRGGDSSLSDQEMHDAVKYMLSKSSISG